DIDRIDDEIHDLLMARAEVVAKVAAAKGPALLTASPIRIEREAQMLRRLAARHTGSLPFMSVADLWHELIAAMTAIQAPFAATIAGGEGAVQRFDLARQQFGSSIPVTVAEDARNAVRQVADGTAGVAVMPPPENGTPGAKAADAPWWTLLTAAEGSPSIVAALPFVVDADGDMPVRRRYLAGDGPRAVALAKAPRNASGDDITLVIATSRGFVSPDSCGETFERAGLSAWRLAFADDPHAGPETDKGAGAPQLHLIAIDGHIERDDDRLDLMGTRHGGPFGEVYPVGGYPVPIGL
ncbi:MAG: hypothetical protein F6K42_20660, partial [Leptolyngbya sp. SIO1D8]|nr:hypothetical protein [Leptolyngbya sp. SIO1D8]